MSSELCVEAMENYHRNRARQIGSQHPEAHPIELVTNGNVLDLKAKNNGLDIMDCVTFVLKVLRDGYKYMALQTDPIYKNGMDLAKYLLNNQGWAAHFWSPDVYRRGNRDSNHTVSFLKAINAPKIGGRPHKPEAFAYKPPFQYYGINLSGMIVGYNRIEPDTNVTNMTANMLAFDRLEKVKFCVGICNGGEHTFLMSEGKVWEVHWKGKGDALYDPPGDRPKFKEYKWWLSGIVMTPPESGFTSRPIPDIIAPIRKAGSGFLCRKFDIFCG